MPRAGHANEFDGHARGRERIAQPLALPDRHLVVGRAVRDQERRIAGVDPGDRVRLLRQLAKDRERPVRIGRVRAQHAEALPRRGKSDQQRARPVRRVVGDDVAGRRGDVRDQLQQVGRTVVVDDRLHAARVLEVIQASFERRDARRRAGERGEVAAGRRAPGADARGVEVEVRTVRTQEPDRRLHVVDLRGERHAFRAVLARFGRQAIVDRRDRHAAVEQRRDERRQRAVAREPAAVVHPDHDRPRPGAVRAVDVHAQRAATDLRKCLVRVGRRLRHDGARPQAGEQQAGEEDDARHGHGSVAGSGRYRPRAGRSPEIFMRRG